MRRQKIEWILLLLTQKEFIMKEHYVLAIDVAKGKSMVSLIGSCGEVLISPYEINHNLNDFKNLDERIKKLVDLAKTSDYGYVIMTGCGEEQEMWENIKQKLINK